MKTETKRFPLDEVLSITPGYLVAVRHMEAIYDLLNWMTNDNLFTHQLPRACKECEPWLLRWFPELGGPEMDAAGKQLEESLKGETDRDKISAICDGWVAEQIVRLGKSFYDLPRIPRDDHEHKDPIQEAVEMVGKDRVIVVALPEGESP